MCQVAQLKMPQAADSLLVVLELEGSQPLWAGLRKRRRYITIPTKTTTEKIRISLVLIFSFTFSGIKTTSFVKLAYYSC
jgi:hypothetical protein